MGGRLRRTEPDVSLLDAVVAMDRPMAFIGLYNGGASFSWVNPAFEAQTGYDFEELVGRSCDVLFGPSTDVAAIEELRLAVKDRRSGRATLLQYRKNGSTLWTDISLSPVPDETGEITHYAAVHVDVTDSVSAQRDLESVYESERRARQQERNALRRAAALAHSLQRSLLPAELPAGKVFDFGAAFAPVGEGLEVGGDFYDVFEQRDGDWVAVIGDVMGKGVDAAAITSLARHVLRTTALRSRKVSTLLKMLNEALCREGEAPFATVAATSFAQTNSGLSMTLALAGHPRPFLVRSSGVTAVGKPGTLAGVIENIEVFEEEVRLQVGDLVVMYTDGVTEARNSEDRFFGEDGLYRLLSQLHPEQLQSAQSVADAVRQGVQSFSDGTARDDLAVLVVRVARDDRAKRTQRGHL